jgi:RNA polymerase sigma-70 factor (ECF subfamily)
MPKLVLEGSERDFVEACQHRNQDAFRELFETYRNRVYSVALRFAEDEATAMDIAQDTFVKLFARIRDFRGDSAFETWVYRMVVNSCLDHRRKQKRLLPLAGSFLSLLRAPGDSLTEMLRSERARRVRNAIERLSPELKIVVVLRYTEGLSYEQIAAVLGCSAGTIGSRLNRAHKKLEKRLADA